MKLRKPLLVLCASAMAVVAFSAFSVSAASASSTEECKTEGFEEIVTSQHFADSACTKKTGAEGEFHTIKLKEKAELTMKETSPIVISWSTAEFAAEIKCEKVMGKVTASNYQKEGKEALEFGFTGEASITLSACKVSKPVGCTVKSIETVPLKLSSEDLAKEVQRTLYAPKSGTKLASITISGCEISGTYALEGELRSQTIDLHSEEFGPSSGSKLTIEKSPVVIKGVICQVTEADNKPIVRELP
jgi:hypothetical protein